MKEIEQLIDRIDLIEQRVDTKLGEVTEIVDERVTTVMKIDRMIRGFRWNWLLIQIVTLILVSNCSYQRGADDMIEWYEEQEDEEVWEAMTSSSQPGRFARSGSNCFRVPFPIRSPTGKCSMPV